MANASIQLGYLYIFYLNMAFSLRQIQKIIVGIF